uniref:60S ribosomal protein L36 n=1 Tax=Phaeomonas parva TaxID=124430 RepID=A0A7S1TW32_9STRA|mmetsp:Transcript_18370/g.56113  ORF Transcript_18370/g.56113 Transcript_18370/m.56113 type:complete len:106 (+) Transcript_18370:112-429(+)|eukprot:CAMPEP_0118851332 /NCGR_PEP_ID=MMETSP1163-20130328/814_1 /TAXON_ID=124430 /ORGANISM="Phaeomonas parva, Strain CCMP2877" /LENGTH=105 /DNA_ID=CAMNT_0006783651 /DNA_START=96 /DNA_END=413 /DNA_ORIENTATION=+
MVSSTGMRAPGANSYPVTKIAKASKPKHRKGKTQAKVALARSVIREVAGLMPYEKRMLDILKTGGATAEKRMYKFAKNRLGTHKRANQKKDDVKAIDAAMRAAQR